MAKIVQVSFTESEDELYREVLKHSSKSGFIKDCIKYYLERYNEPDKMVKAPQKRSHITPDITNILDFD